MSKEILIFKHIDIEGPGSIEEFFGNTAWKVRITDLSRQRLKLGNFNDVTAIILLGGPMNVYEEDKYPFLQYENELLKKATNKEIPILGICLGAQILAKACGAKVKKSRTKEIGWSKVNLTEEGKRDTLFENLTSEFNVFQWHQDSFDIPNGGLHLAESLSCANQAFRFGKNAYGLQFHIEVTPEMIETWIDKYTENEPLGFDAKDMLIESYKRKENFKRQADLVYFNFAKIISAFQRKPLHQ